MAKRKVENARLKAGALFGWRQMTDRMSGDDMVPDREPKVAVLWGDVVCPDRGGLEERRPCDRWTRHRFSLVINDDYASIFFCTVMQIRSLKDIGVTILIFWGRDVIGHVIIGFAYPEYSTLEPNWSGSDAWLLRCISLKMQNHGRHGHPSWAETIWAAVKKC